MACCFSFRAASSFSSLSALSCVARVALDLLSRPRLSFSISICRIFRSTSSKTSGLLVTSIFNFAAASSTRSMALSGRKRSAKYRSASTAASTRALSDMRTPWCSSYFSRKPRKIEIVSSTLGSSTRTCWKRRSSAGSFSTYCRYSSRVVAPMHCSSPRPSMGFSKLPASTAPPPAPPPAPTTVWNSSMNKMICPSESVTSLITAFSRSSNSPRNLAPAIKEPISRLIMVRPSSAFGTSPCTMRCASPSEMAVLPTPGSPMRIGLFLERRERI
mmetsp:Transcript_11281/g.41288  ORF Transcript_11281/g.41288 Transcript_11281/m.41288 type:complete len:273 (-) Transcript_11281:1001-1819(-)